MPIEPSQGLMKWMRWVWGNGGMKFEVGENGRNGEKNLPRPRFIHRETHMVWPRRELGTTVVGGERLTACATRPPYTTIKYYNWNLTITFSQSTLPEHLCNVASSRTTIGCTGASHCQAVHRAPLVCCNRIFRCWKPLPTQSDLHRREQKK